MFRKGLWLKVGRGLWDGEAGTRVRDVGRRDVGCGTRGSDIGDGDGRMIKLLILNRINFNCSRLYCYQVVFYFFSKSTGKSGSLLSKIF